MFKTLLKVTMLFVFVCLVACGCIDDSEMGANSRTITFYDFETAETIQDVSVEFYKGYRLKEYTDISDSTGTVDITSFSEGSYWAKAFKTGYLPIHIRNTGSIDNTKKVEYIIYMDPVVTEVGPDNLYYSVDQGMRSTSQDIGNYSERSALLTTFNNLIVNEVQDDLVPGKENQNAGYNDEYVFSTGNLLSLDLRQMLKIRQDQMFAEIEAYTGDSLAIFKDYNEGIILKESGTTIAIDLIQTSTHTLDRDSIETIDAFFTTHEHQDHCDTYIAKVAGEQLIPYYVPNYMLDYFFNGEWENHHTDMLIDAIGMSGGDIVWINSWSIEAIETYHPNTETHHVYLITSPSGIRVLHFGDAYQYDDWDAYNIVDGVPPENLRGVDYMIAPVWWGSEVLDKFIDIFNPKVYIPGHDNELGHAAEDRYPHSFGLDYLENIDKVQVLFYGESASSLQLQ